MSLIAKTTHAAEALARLAQQFKGKVLLEGLIAAFVEQAQDREDVQAQLYTLRWLATAAGTQLDGIGSILGEARLGKDDATYRIDLAARILILRSSGTPDQLLDLTRMLLGVGVVFQLVDWYPAAWVIIVDDAFPSDPEALAAILGQTRAAGVRGCLEYTLVDDDVTFTFATGDTAEADSEQGFGDDADVPNGGFSDWVVTPGDPDSWITSESLPTQEISQVSPAEGHGGTGTGACNIYAAIAAPCSIYQDLTLVPGQSYTLRFSITHISGGTLVVSDNWSAAFSETYDAVGDYEITFTAGAGTALFMGCDGITGCDITIDNVSLAGGVWADAEEA